MNRPSFAVRVAGSPVGSLLLWALCGAVVLGWYAGHIHWWLGIAAIAAAMRTRTAVKSLRRYNAWAAEWAAMGEDDAPALPQVKRRSGGRWLVALAVVLAVMMPVVANMRSGPGSDALLLLWCAGCLFLAVAMLRAVLLRIGSRSKSKPVVAGSRAKAAEDLPVVTWLIERPLSSPSRADAERELPDYCARLIDRSPGKAL